MLTLLVSWVAAAFILTSSGDFFTLVYNKLSQSKEHYGLLDTFMLGICLLLIPLQLLSLWLPVNEYLLAGYLIAGILYWIFNKKRLNKRIGEIKQVMRSLSKMQKAIIALSVFVLFIYALFLTNTFDSVYYHYQNIRWNEEYPVVPGLGNLEDRFGFNSNYLLISALFSFRFMFGEAVYSIQSLLFVLIVCWGLVNIIRSGFDIKYVALIVILLLVFLSGDGYLDNTSTDIIPMLCVFYYIAKTVFSPSWITKQPLLSCLLPVCLITLKMSAAIFCITSLGILIYLITRKQYRTSIFICITSLLILSLWCVRNVIISGYLVYPIAEIDLFSFDWKMPEATLTLQRLYISDWAKFMLWRDLDIDRFLLEWGKYKIWGISILSNWIVYVIALMSPFTILYSITRKKDIHKYIYYVYIVTLICIVFNIALAPDPRFMLGYIYGCAFIHLYILSSMICGKYSLMKWSNIILVIWIISLGFVTYKKRVLIFSHVYNNNKELLSRLLYLPVPHPRDYEVKNQYDKYDMNGAIIYVVRGGSTKLFDVIPTVASGGLPFRVFDGNKIQSIETIELRGSTLKEGFRTKEKYKSILNENIDQYKKDYHTAFENKIK